MTDPAAGDPAAAGSARDGSGVTAEEARRRRREQVFGEVLPESTSDDRDPGTGRGGGHDAWLRDNVPPHHG